MIKYIKSISVLAFFLIICLSSVEKTPKALIIGDSISIGYTKYVKQKLKNKIEIIHNKGNAQHTGTGLAKIKEWIGEDDWDVIQFNWGLWDLCYRHPDSKIQGKRDKVNGTICYSVEEYQQNLDSLVRTIKSLTKAQLIFVTTTYVPESEAGRFHDDAIIYNRAALEVMKKYNVQVNDIYEPSVIIHKQSGLGPDNVHFTEEGYQKLADLIVPILEKAVIKLN